MEPNKRIEPRRCRARLMTSVRRAAPRPRLIVDVSRYPQSFLFEPASSASGTPRNAQPFAGLLCDVFDPAIIRAAALTATVEAVGA